MAPSDTEIIQGQTAQLKCAVDDMTGTLLWTKDGFSLGQSVYYRFCVFL